MAELGSSRQLLVYKLFYFVGIQCMSLCTVRQGTAENTLPHTQLQSFHEDGYELRLNLAEFQAA